MSNANLPNRRSVLQTLGAGTVAALAAPQLSRGRTDSHEGQHQAIGLPLVLRTIPLEKLADGSARRSATSRSSCSAPQEYQEVKPLGLTCAVIGGADIANGLNRKENHDKHRQATPRAASSSPPPRGCPTSSACPATARAWPTRRAWTIAPIGLKQHGRLRRGEEGHPHHGGAEQQGRPQGLHVRQARPGASSCARRSARDRFKLLYDIYHMQIMEGDVIRTIHDSTRTTSATITRAATRAATRSTRRRS